MARRSYMRSAGFTLTELVTVIVIAGILAVFAVARIDTKAFNTEGYANQVAAAIRYAQKTAISQHRNVTVTATGTAVALTYTDAPLAGTPVHQPPGTSAFTIGAPADVAVSGGPITFSALGKPVGGGATIAITGDVTRNVIVEAETGYVRYTP
jgi:MSHA pilin protein MshC